MSPSIPPMPDEGWSRTVTVHEGAIVAPPTVSRPRTPSGVWCNGDVTEASMWRHDDRMSLALPEKPHAESELTGHYLFGGMFYKHFGHFITEAIGRLWANDNSFDGILMTPKHAGMGHFKRWQRELLTILNVKKLPILVEAPVLVERLSVPGQGFGLGSISRATPEFKKLIRATIGKMPADGPEKIYISRTQYGAQGGILGESVLEENLRRSGYVPIYAEKMSWKDQIAVYRSAKKIISVDSSALHMVGLASDAGTDVAVIIRRNNFEWDCMKWQLESFLEKAPLIVNELVAEYLVTGKKSNHQSWGVLDFAGVRAELAKAGFISPDAPWDVPSEELLAADAVEAQRRDPRPLVRAPVLQRAI